MRKKIPLAYSLPAIVLSTLLVLTIVFAWTEPSTAPPEGNVSTPINIGATGQTKSGALNISGGFESTGSTLLATSGGKVGIGTTTPVGKLDVFGGMLYVRAASGPAVGAEQIRIGRWDNDIRYHSIYSSHSAVDDTNYLQFRVHDKGGIPYTGQVTVMTLLGTGNVGIGTTTPTQKLEVAGNIKGPGAESSITNFKNIIGRSGPPPYNDGILHLMAGTASGPIFLNWGKSGNVQVGDGSISTNMVLAKGNLTLSSGSLSLITGNLTLLGGSLTLSTGNFTLNSGQIKIVSGAGVGKVLTSDAVGLASWQTAAGGIGGSGTANYLSKWTAVSTLGNSVIYESGGNVGIGTVSPGAKLEVAGQIKITGGTPGANKVLTSDAAGLASWQALTGTLPSGTSGQTLRHDGANWVANSVIFNNGTNVGIRTISPAITLAIGDTDTGLNWISDGNLAVYTNNVERMRITSGGNVGIGTISPNAALQVNGAITRQGSTLAGTNPETQVNLGVNSSTFNNYSTIGGGLNNQITVGSCLNCSYSTIGGGRDNKATTEGATISGGIENEIQGNGNYNTIAGGRYNVINSSLAAAIGGGRGNFISASGFQATIPGGYMNRAYGITSFAAGTYAAADHDSSFVWSSSASSVVGDSYRHSAGDRTFNVFANGVYFNSARKWDIAEFMDVLKSDAVEEGEIVSLMGNDLLGKSKKPYDDSIIGVVSSKKTSTMFLGDTDNEGELKKEITRLPIGLVGRSFVKVSNEGGNITLGDPITSSFTPGVGMKAEKAGKIIGYAMENADFTNQDEAEILIFINVGYFVPTQEYKNILSEIKELRKEIDALKNR